MDASTEFIYQAQSTTVKSTLRTHTGWGQRGVSRDMAAVQTLAWKSQKYKRKVRIQQRNKLANYSNYDKKKKIQIWMTSGG